MIKDKNMERIKCPVKWVLSDMELATIEDGSDETHENMIHSEYDFAGTLCRMR